MYIHDIYSTHNLYIHVHIHDIHRLITDLIIQVKSKKSFFFFFYIFIPSTSIKSTTCIRVTDYIPSYMYVQLYSYSLLLVLVSLVLVLHVLLEYYMSCST